MDQETEPAEIVYIKNPDGGLSRALRRGNSLIPVNLPNNTPLTSGDTPRSVIDYVERARESYRLSQMSELNQILI